MRKFLLVVAVVWVIALMLTCHAYAGGYGAAPPRAVVPQCATCPEATPLPQAQINYVPRTVQFQETVYEPRTIVREQTVYEPQLSFAPQRSYAPGCYQAQPAFAPGCYSAQASFVAHRQFAPRRARGFVGAGVSYGYSAHGVVGGGAIARSPRGNFAAGSGGFVTGGSFVGGGFSGGGDIAISQRNQAVVAPAGSRVTTRSGGLRGVLFGQVTRVR